MPNTPSAHQHYDTIILGAGAAGLMAAFTAGKHRRVLILDHNPLPGRKILISGGGRANFTNIHASSANYLSQNPHFAKSALALYTPQHFLELIHHHHIPYHEKTLGQLFCDRSAHDLLNMLLAECAAANVTQIYNAKNIAVEHDNSYFQITSSQGAFRSESLIIATGGLSIPKLGATPIGYQIARQFGHTIIEPTPALVPLTLGGTEAAWTQLSGLSALITTIAGAGKQKTTFREKMLFTHRGLSGPAILQASSYWQPNTPLHVDLAPQQNLLAPLLEPNTTRDAATLRRILAEHFPQRLAELLAALHTSGFSNAALSALEAKLHLYPYHPTGTEGFSKAEVTLGGVSTDQLNARTLESRLRSGLFFIGEVVDVTGHLGGFNFQWAWSSAVAAGRAV